MAKIAPKYLAALLALLLLVPCFSPAAGAAFAPEEADYLVERWGMQEIPFTSQAAYADPFNDAELNVTFTGPGGITMVMPAFWDGGDTWKVRFAPPEEGLWRWETACSNPADAGLHGVSGTIGCAPYAGELEIYRRGFLKTEPGVRYLMYADGTPFFYLGDTHWSMPAEPFDTMFKTIVDERARQGFTVYQSEPIGAGYSLGGGLDETDLAGFADLDRRFDYIARAGMVHANAQLIFGSELFYGVRDGKYTQDYIRRLSRCWVARYGAYPVLWTTAQEVDDDMYYDRDGVGGQAIYTAADNPWKIVAETIGACDPYRHPLSAHQEYASMDPAHGMNASKSEFAKLPAHTWFAAQWSPSLTRSPDFALARDFWQNGGGKPVVNYEGRYENLWTKNFGARAQGWISFLNGMYGYGYGAVDMWLYQSAYDIDTTSSDGVDTITPADKAVPWTESLYFETAGQLGHMRRFLQDASWWELTPRFCRWRWFIPCWRANYSVASHGNDAYVAYFYNANRSTGLLRGLDKADYQAQWFSPRTGETLPLGAVRSRLGMYLIPRKPDQSDWVFYLYRTGQEG